MNQYQDHNGLWHDRDIKRYGLSNNWQNYTAMALYLGLPVDGKSYRQYFRQCANQMRAGNFKILRHPNKTRPPYSADCLIGDFIMGQIPYRDLKGNHFVFHGKGEPLSIKTIEKTLKGIAKLTMFANIFGYSRNLFWEKEIKELYQLAYRLHPGYVYFVKKSVGATIHKEEKLLWKEYVKHTTKSKKTNRGAISQKNLLWLMAMHLGDKKLAKRCKPEVNIPAYFGDHPFTDRIKELHAKGLL